MSAAIKRRPARLRHGEARKGAETPEYRAWKAMIGRCSNANGPNYAYYGGRGIRVAPEWLGRDGFERFIAHIGRRPTPKHTVDRIDNARNYEPGNVRWATRAEQSANRRSVRLITLGARTMSIAAWARELGVDQNLIRGRLDAGWPPERALAAPTFKPGERGWKLTAEQVAEIRRLLREGRSKRSLARMFGVAPRTIGRIGDGRIWRTM